MRALIQRVKKAELGIDGKVHSQIGHGCVIFLGVGEGDTEKDVEFLADKTVNLRIFSNDEGKFDHSLLDVKGAALVVSQFTLYGDSRKGRRPDFTAAAKPEQANKLYEYFVELLKNKSLEVKTGVFAADMTVELTNYGPVTIWLDSKN